MVYLLATKSSLYGYFKAKVVEALATESSVMDLVKPHNRGLESEALRV